MFCVASDWLQEEECLMCLTHRHSLCVGICYEDVSVGHRHQRGENCSFLGPWDQLESGKKKKKKSMSRINHLLALCICLYCIRNTTLLGDGTLFSHCWPHG